MCVPGKGDPLGREPPLRHKPHATAGRPPERKPTLLGPTYGRATPRLRSAPAITILIDAHNHPDCRRTLLRQAGLDRLVEQVVSVEDVKLFKPRPEVYAHAARQCRVRLNRMALVAVHPWDINGAKAAGCIGAYVTVDRPFASTMRAPDLQAPSLAAAVRALATL